MASNPMQKKSKNAFILGMIVALLIGAAVAGFLAMRLKKANTEILQYKSSITKVYALTQNVNSGDILTMDMFGQVDAISASIPTDYVDIGTLLSAYSLYTKNGEPIRSEYKKDENNAEKQHLYTKIDNKDVEIFKDETTGSFYYGNNNDKTFIETTEAPVIIKIGAKSKTIISPSMVARSNEIYSDDVREQEYNVVVLPVELVQNDYIDVRLMIPNGQDFIVLSKKMVSIPKIGEEFLTDTIKMNLSEDEILTMSCAIVEAAKIKNAKLYATKYVEAGLQEAAKPTYLVNEDVASLIDNDSNVVAEAKKTLVQRYSSNLKEIRNRYINSELTKNKENEENDYQTKLQESITSTKDARQKYLQSLTTSTTSGTTTY